MPSSPIHIKTRRLLLREVSRTDAQALVEGRPVGSLALADGYPCLDRPGRFTAQDPTSVLVLFEEDTKVVGDCSILTRDDAAEISYCIVPSREGRGLGSEAVTEVVSELLGRPDVRCVEAVILDGNAASRRIAEKAGLREVERAPGGAWYRRCRDTESPAT